MIQTPGNKFKQGRAMRRSAFGAKGPVDGKMGGPPNAYTQSAIDCYDASIALWYAVCFAGHRPQWTEGGPEQWHDLDIDRHHINAAIKTVKGCASYRAKYDAAVAKCLQLNEPMVHAVAYKFSRSGTDLTREDLVQEGILGLIRAIRKFQPKMGYQFSTYCYYWIYQAISRACAEAHLIHVPLNNDKVRDPSLQDKAKCARSLTSLNETVSDANAIDTGTQKYATIASTEFLGTEDVIAAHQDRRNLLHAMSSELTPREMLVLRLRFEDDLTLEEVGAMVGRSQNSSKGADKSLTRERIRQIERQALQKLRDYMDRDEANLPELSEE